MLHINVCMCCIYMFMWVFVLWLGVVIPRKIPLFLWYRNTPMCIIIGGLIPFWYVYMYVAYKCVYMYVTYTCVRVCYVCMCSVVCVHVPTLYHVRNRYCHGIEIHQCILLLVT